MKNNVYPCKPQFYYIIVGFKGVKIILACFRDDNRALMTAQSLTFFDGLCLTLFVYGWADCGFIRLNP